MCVPAQPIPNRSFVNEEAKNPNTSHSGACRQIHELSVQTPLTDQLPVFIRPSA